MKRFFKTCGVQTCDKGEGFQVALDDHILKTAAKRPMILPTFELAQKIAQEWHSQGDEIQPDTMPMTGYAFTVLDVVKDKQEAVRKEVICYAETDLLCYITQEPAELNARLLSAWQPILNWLEEKLQAPFVVTSGLMAIAQPAESISQIAERIDHLDLWQLTAIQSLTSILGSILLALAIKEGRLTADEAFLLARIEEDFQAEQWGQDEDSDKKMARDREEVRNAASFLQMTAVMDYKQATVLQKGNGVV